MIKQQILEYFKNQQSEFIINFKPAFTFNNEKAIHDMRVSIKRLRLLYRFLNFFSDKQFSAKRQAKLLIDVFKSAGPLRDIQIQQSILEKNKSNLQSDYTTLANFLLLKEKIEFTKFKETLNKLDFNKIAQFFSLSEALLMVIINYTDLEDSFKNYEKNRQLNIQNLLKGTSSEIDYHKLRKRIKDLTYLAEIRQIQTEKSNNNFLNLKQLGSKLGDWHDLEVFLNELKLLKENQKKETASYTEIEVKLKQKQQIIIDEFHLKYKQLL